MIMDTRLSSHLVRITGAVAKGIQEPAERPDTAQRRSVDRELQAYDQSARNDLRQPFKRVLVGA